MKKRNRDRKTKSYYEKIYPKVKADLASGKYTVRQISEKWNVTSSYINTISKHIKVEKQMVKNMKVRHMEKLVKDARKMRVSELFMLIFQGAITLFVGSLILFIVLHKTR